MEGQGKAAGMPRSSPQYNAFRRVTTKWDQYLLPNHGVVVVSVVVVVTGLRTVVSCDVVVVRWVALSELHPVMATRAMATRQGRMIFFISMVV